MISIDSKEFDSIDFNLWIKYFELIHNIQNNIEGTFYGRNKDYSALKQFLLKNKQLHDILINNLKSTYGAHIESLYRFLTFDNKRIMCKYFPVLKSKQRYTLQSYKKRTVFSWGKTFNAVRNGLYDIGYGDASLILRMKNVPINTILYTYNMFNIWKVNDWLDKSNVHSFYLDDDFSAEQEFIVWHKEPMNANIVWYEV